MSLLASVPIALDGIYAHCGRTALATLGIVIGIGAVIAMTAIGAGAARQVEERIRELAWGDLTIFGGGTPYDVPDSEFLSVDEVKAIRERATLVGEMVPLTVSGGPVPVAFRDRDADVTVIASYPAFFAENDLALDRGRLLGWADERTRRRAVVLGAGIARTLAALADVDSTVSSHRLIGERILVRGLSYEVAGILRPSARAIWGTNLDDVAIMPLETGREHLFTSGSVAMVTVQAVSRERIVDAAEEIERIMRRLRRLRPDQPNTFRVNPRFDFEEVRQKTADTFGRLLLAIAAIGLVVGGTGVANIMLVNVTERTREIGIRKALGARRSAILAQFLVEAILLCVAGGLGGIAGGTYAAHVLATKFGWVTLVAPESVVLALGVSAAVGLVAGLWPAARAARLDPIDALRHE